MAVGAERAHADLEVPRARVHAVRRSHHPVPLVPRRREHVITERDLRRPARARELDDRIVLRRRVLLRARRGDQPVLLRQLDVLRRRRRPRFALLRARFLLLPALPLVASRAAALGLRRRLRARPGAIRAGHARRRWRGQHARAGAVTTLTELATVPLSWGFRWSLAGRKLRSETSSLSSETVSSPALCAWCRHLLTALFSTSCSSERPVVSEPPHFPWIHALMSAVGTHLRDSPSEVPSSERSRLYTAVCARSGGRGGRQRRGGRGGRGGCAPARPTTTCWAAPRTARCLRRRCGRRSGSSAGTRRTPPICPPPSPRARGTTACTARTGAPDRRACAWCRCSRSGSAS